MSTCPRFRFLCYFAIVRLRIRGGSEEQPRARHRKFRLPALSLANPPTMPSSWPKSLKPRLRGLRLLRRKPTQNEARAAGLCRRACASAGKKARPSSSMRAMPCRWMARTISSRWTSRSRTSATSLSMRLGLSAIVNVLQSTEARTSIVVLDACRGNPFGYAQGTGGGLAKVEASSGSLIAFSASPGAVAPDGARGRQ